MGGVYYAYPVESGDVAPDIKSAPEGYEPFYISHYGRHGSRWLTNDNRYIWVNKHFEDQKNLTKLGKSVRKRLAKIWKDAKGNGGKLTALGARQHRGIASRMYQNFPQLFTSDADITAHSSVVGRCRSSMLAFLEALGNLSGHKDLESITDSADMAWIAYTSPEEKALENRTVLPLRISTDRFIKALFIDPSKVDDPAKLLMELHTIASDMQDVELDVSLYDIFTPEEFQAVYDKNNESMTIVHGDLIQNEGIPARSALSLWQRIEADADAAIASGKKGADLRFGHDSNLYRLLTLIGLDLSEKSKEINGKICGIMDEILPMAANLQMIFYRNAQGDVLVQLLHNEKPAKMGYSPSQNFYRWEELKQKV
ncbi:MAG: histidine-type phosphatase, partial [Prevotella sp.]|nr:histidine-type phosphatase [Prevotella sp.]